MKVPYLFILSHRVADSATAFRNATSADTKAKTVEYFTNAILHVNELETSWFKPPANGPIYPSNLSRIYGMQFNLLEDPQIKYWTSTVIRFHNLINYMFMIGQKVPCGGIATIGTCLSQWYQENLIPVLPHSGYSESNFCSPIPYFGPMKFYKSDSDPIEAHKAHFDAMCNDSRLLFLDLGEDG